MPSAATERAAKRLLASRHGKSVDLSGAVCYAYLDYWTREVVEYASFREEPTMHPDFMRQYVLASRHDGRRWNPASHETAQSGLSATISAESATDTNI